MAEEASYLLTELYCGTFDKFVPLFSFKNVQLSNFILMSLIPALVLTIGNYLIYRKISRSAGIEYTIKIGIEYSAIIGKEYSGNIGRVCTRNQVSW